MHSWLTKVQEIKTLHINFDKLVEKLKKFPLKKVYTSLQKFYRIIHLSGNSLDNTTYKYICECMLVPRLRKLAGKLSKSKDNLLSHIKYNPENYPGLLIKIKTPNVINENKKTTIKIFPSGKINIDGANSRTEAELIYFWLNDLFHQNSELLQHEINYDETDSEFSSDSEED